MKDFLLFFRCGSGLTVDVYVFVFYFIVAALLWEHFGFLLSPNLTIIM